MKQLYFILLAIILTASSCKSTKENMQTNSSLYNTKWLLKKIHGADRTTNVQTDAFISFDKDKGSAGGNGSCNSFGSDVTINGNDISFQNIFSTKMFCEDVQAIENNFFKGLRNVNRFEVKKSSLFLYHDKQLLLEFTAE